MTAEKWPEDLYLWNRRRIKSGPLHRRKLVFLGSVVGRMPVASYITGLSIGIIRTGPDLDTLAALHTGILSLYAGAGLAYRAEIGRILAYRAEIGRIPATFDTELQLLAPVSKGEFATAVVEWPATKRIVSHPIYLTVAVTVEPA